MKRIGRVERETKQTKILVELGLDGTGRSTVRTGVPFFEHMLAQLAKHGLLDLTVQAEGDIEIDALLLVRLPYHLSAQPQATARAALAHAPALLATVADLRAERDGLVGWLRGRGLVAADSDANFVLFGEFGDSHAVWQGLLGRGVLVREVGPPGWLRVSIGTPAEMTAFRDALTEVLGTDTATGGGH